MQVNTGNVGGISSLDMQGMDLETLMMAVQSKRAQLLETQLKGQIEAVQARNTNMANLNNVMAELNALDAKFPSDAGPDTKLGDKIEGWKDNNYAIAREHEAKLNTALKTAGLTDALPDNGDKGQLTLNPFEHGFAHGLNSKTTKADISAAINKVKSLIDAQSNSQQSDMLRLQSLSNKRNEAFDLMTNFVKKMQDNRSSILGNMR